MKKAVLLTLAVIMWLFIIWQFSAKASLFLGDNDFTAFYNAAAIIIDPAIPNSAVYDPDITVVPFRYSMLVAYLFSPLALLPFGLAKTLMIFLNITAYLGVVILLLNRFKLSIWILCCAIIASLLWFPLIYNIAMIQVNAIIALMVIVGVFSAEKRPALGGVLLGLAALIKPFPFAVAMVLGVKNLRVFAGCAVMVGLALLLPGTSEWIGNFNNPPHPAACYSPIFNLFGQSMLRFLPFAAVVGGITALVAWKNRDKSYLELTALSLPASFLAMPIIEPHHLTVLLFSYIYLLSRRLPLSQAIFAALSYMFLYAGCMVNPHALAPSPYLAVGLLMLWGVLLIHIESPAPHLATTPAL